MLSVRDVADFFLSPVDEEDGEATISNLKLQKLLYYAQGYSLALFGQKLFDENISCWTHGPVVESIYHQFKIYGSSPLPVAHIEMNKYNDEHLYILNRVRREYGQFTAWKLRDMTHEELPYLSTPNGGVINTACIKEFFINKLSNDNFNFDLERMKKRVEGDFVKMPDTQDKDSFMQWVKSF
ncbi:hypothetical protein V757_04390 [Pelistega indica]|uniref:Antitoxin SocA-like Panacea domain-containing protein n=1 Tax=Pelistega indica TaxID=1414851 RepID=V8G738_9BURK|nr:type II toxin-antitoxin system antitoxin SocA domain-containing protein [Pelistega indica]ETD72359.1 hypothetical protein V757_04390 [Pelistega indica]